MLIVIIAYFPLLSLQYIEGLLFRPMAITLCFALFGALLIALYVVPVLASFLFKRKTVIKEESPLDRLTEKYRAVLPRVLEKRV
ncbi:efflux RND transporter permease subunit, partial [Streptomyces brasiliscabiei]|uniref:efflux RND transporter permease subunit n=1 Tax=Streptomyces brasiliscabiei TaxID=2736302 RepID=UPI0038F64160